MLMLSCSVLSEQCPVFSILIYTDLRFELSDFIRLIKILESGGRSVWICFDIEVGIWPLPIFKMFKINEKNKMGLSCPKLKPAYILASDKSSHLVKLSHVFNSIQVEITKYSIIPPSNQMHSLLVSQLVMAKGTSLAKLCLSFQLQLQ